ncbi:hypothetical protein EZS27_036545 [termite gut metagenome]|uniref:mRNA interferase HigB n=1 Tax=termite gut metagenome TaxID=433724 RepID=A0A5J4PUV0_9ZZZZ
MRIITHKSITNFCINYTDAQVALEEWFIKTKNAEWTCFADIKKTFNSVDNVGNQHYVFNIKGNTYRLVAIIHFQIKRYIYVLSALTMNMKK